MFTLDIQDQPNLSDSNYDQELIKPEYIIIHCIGYIETEALTILTGEDSAVSCHYFVPQYQSSSSCNPLSLITEYPIYHISTLIDEQDNEVVKMYHAGRSYWHDESSFNGKSIGVEFNIPNYANALNAEGEGLDWYHFEGLTFEQMIAGQILLQQLMEQYDIPPENVLFHSNISPWYADPETHEIIGGKTDPGPLFPAEYYTYQGIGIWPKHDYIPGEYKDTSIHNAQYLLHEVGYLVAVTDQ
ncbi:MAG: N-acetylmuramoyl-L-alanine amidase [Burkholderiales bacterium]